MSALSIPFFHDAAADHAMLEEIIWPFGPVCPRCNGNGPLNQWLQASAAIRACGPWTASTKQRGA